MSNNLNGNGERLGPAGRLAALFQGSAITPLLALVGLLLGLFAVLVTPKEEEPQIDVTFADVYIPFPGASPAEVESLVTTPAEQVVSQIKGIDTLYSFSQPDGALLRQGEFNGVYLQQPAGWALTPVRVGHCMDGQCEILAGLQAGDKLAPDAWAQQQELAHE